LFVCFLDIGYLLPNIGEKKRNGVTFQNIQYGYATVQKKKTFSV